MVLRYTGDSLSSSFAHKPPGGRQDAAKGTSEPINLLKGWPNPALLPAKELLAAAGEALTNPSIYVPGLLYGPDEGHGPLRDAVGKWLGDFYRNAVTEYRHEKHIATSEDFEISSERITITGGASQALGCILNALTDPIVTRRVWIVAPAYFLAFKIFEDAGFSNRMRSVPEMDGSKNPTEAGPDVDWLRKEMKLVDEEWERREASLKPTPTTKFPKIYRHVIYCVPNFANPSSVTTSINVREALVRRAKEFDALLVCDDVYDMLQWPADPSTVMEGNDHLSRAQLPRIVDVERYLDGGVSEDDFGNVISNGSFSKISAPGCRTGWVEAAPKLAFAVSQAGTTKSGGAPSQMASTLITQLVTSGTLTQRINHVLQPAYARRYRIMVDAIEEHLVPLGINLPQPGRAVVGGYFTWLRLPTKLRRRGPELVQRAEMEGEVIVTGGELFEVPGDELRRSNTTRQEDIDRTSFQDFVRLCFAWEEEDRLAEGVNRLASIIQTMLDEEERGVAPRRSTSRIDVSDMKDKS